METVIVIHQRHLNEMTKREAEDYLFGCWIDNGYNDTLPVVYISEEGERKDMFIVDLMNKYDIIAF